MERFGNLLTGIGTFLLGVGGVVALVQADGVINEILKVQKMAEDLHQNAVAQQATLAVINTQVTELASQRAMVKLDAIKQSTGTVTESDVRQVMNEVATTVPGGATGQVMPEVEIGKVVNAYRTSKNSQNLKETLRDQFQTTGMLGLQQLVTRKNATEKR